MDRGEGLLLVVVYGYDVIASVQGNHRFVVETKLRVDVVRANRWHDVVVARVDHQRAERSVASTALYYTEQSERRFHCRTG